MVALAALAIGPDGHAGGAVTPEVAMEVRLANREGEVAGFALGVLLVNTLTP
jgi:hypothetical protein